jgi:hypothetical protein
MREAAIPKAWRLGARCAGLAAWIVFLYAVAHRSEEPEVLGRWSAAYSALLAFGFVGAVAIIVMNFAAPLAWLYRSRSQLLGMAFASALSLALLEGATRAFDVLGVSYFEETKRYHLDKVADSELIYTHRPNAVNVYQSVPIAFNELGFRDEPVAPRRPGELRILLLGDSVAFGWGVEASLVFATRLEEILSEKLDRPVAVINTAVGSYNTVQQLAVLQRHGEPLAPDLVILLYVYNDVEEHAVPFDPHSLFALSGKNALGKLKVVLGRSWFYRLLSHVGDRLGEQPLLPDSSFARSPGWIASLGALEQIGTWTKKHGTPFVLYVWRYMAYEQDPLWRDLVEVAGTHDFPIREAAPAWVPSSREFHLSTIDSHPNAEGHRRVAEGIAADLMARGLTGDPDERRRREY